MADPKKPDPKKSDDPTPEDSEDFGPFAPQESPGYIDLPFESGSADPQPLKYADLGDQYRYDPEGDFGAAQKRAKEETDDGS